jgi:5'-nucleotidase
MKILYIDMDNVLVDFESAFRHFPHEVLEQYRQHLDDVPGIFSKMMPMVGAAEAFFTLREDFDTYILSTAPWNNPSAWSDKLQWVKTHLGLAGYKRLILSHHKNLNKGHFLVDDRERNGAEIFEGQLIKFGSPEFPDWPAVTKYLRAQL